MNILERIGSTIGYISEAVSEWFRPSRDEYPKTGVQPFEGEPYSKWVSAPPRSEDAK